jgi:predicted DNA-binding transcriptional regulator YafY
LSRFKGIPQFEFINEIIPAIESKLGLVSLEREVISFENNLDYVGAKFITPLFNAIVNKRSLTVEYQDFKSPFPYTIAFHPYYLKQYNNRWFTFGYNELTENKYWNMALDRIKSTEEAQAEYIETDIDWEDYFFDIIGVTKKVEQELQSIRLWFSPSQAPYVVTKPIHPSQKSKNTEDGLEVTIQVVPNYELEKLILSFGETVQVLSPVSLRSKISERIKNSMKLY